ncbi:MAG: DUF2202 domain-containing protein [Spirochaetales bacterium]|nr:DUF2202 domain-containing protein [Spirochaetales bacterium]
MKVKLLSIIIVILIVSTALYARGPKGQGQGFNSTGNNAGDHLEIYPMEDLNNAEAQGLIKMREEEKLARDVYAALYEKWNVPVFKNIAASEDQHMSAVKSLLSRYNLQDPVVTNEPGIFTDPEFTGLYKDLVTKGSQSIEAAFGVGAMIEDLDIADLKKLAGATDNQDVAAVYENLIRGSENHLRAFVKQLSRYGQSYAPAYISQDDYDSIINNSGDRGNNNFNRGNGNGNYYRNSL